MLVHFNLVIHVYIFTIIDALESWALASQTPLLTYFLTYFYIVDVVQSSIEGMPIHRPSKSTKLVFLEMTLY